MFFDIVSSLKSISVGVFIPEKLASTLNQVFSLPKELVIEHLLVCY